MTKVMLIEDDQTMLTLLKTLLELEGYEVFRFFGQSPDQLVPELLQEKPDILLLDVHFRHINGLDLLDSIRKNDQFDDMRIIMMSGIDLSERCIHFGANDFILKPFMPDELISKLQGQTA